MLFSSTGTIIGMLRRSTGRETVIRGRRYLGSWRSSRFRIAFGYACVRVRKSVQTIERTLERASWDARQTGICHLERLIQYLSKYTFSFGSYTEDSYTPPFERIVLRLPSLLSMQVISTLSMPSSLHLGKAVLSI